MKIVHKELVCSFALCLLVSDPAISASPGDHPFQTASPGRLLLPSAFPADDYTPHGYLTNPFHSMVANRSGVIKTYPPLGIGWWRANLGEGGYGGGDRDHVNYVSLLQMSVAIGDAAFVTEDDFTRAGIQLGSAYHTGHAISYDWRAGAVSVSLKCMLLGEHTLACFVTVMNRSPVRQDIRVCATHIYAIGETSWWGSDGLTSRYNREDHASVSKVWAYGDVFALAGSIPITAHLSTTSSGAWEQWVRSSHPLSVDEASVKGRGPLRTTQLFRLEVPPGEQKDMTILLSRGTNEAAALNTLSHGFAEAFASATKLLEEDERFWASCPKLSGDWPAAWRRGWVYDFETLRMNVHKPLGIFHHPWDGMQIHSPRVVLGETSMDMMTLGYADPALAREVMFGTFADGIAPNIPCAREDGSVNMIGTDGSECGTAPMWGYPFHVLRALCTTSQDTMWLANLYPYLASYLRWWLAHRTDSAGWLHCNNSWESGQDGSRRFLVAEHNEGAVADFVRTVDVESSTAEALMTMSLFADVLHRQQDAAEWRSLANRRVQNTRSMFFDGWYRDFDGRNGKPIVLRDYYDVMMLAPVACGVATPEHIAGVRDKFEYFLAHPSPSLEWPPLLFTFAEAAWSAGERVAAASGVASAADRVFRRMDRRTVSSRREDLPFAYRIPGVANEFWPVQDHPPGGENYGWGATLPMFIIRNIIGFREAPGLSSDSCIIAPCIPPLLMKAGKSYSISDLKTGKDTLHISVNCLEGWKLNVEVRSGTRVACRYLVTERGTGRVVADATVDAGKPIAWTGSNSGVYVLRRI
jgi:hypothetical protein